MAPAFAVAGFNEVGCTIIFDLISFEAQRSDEGRPFSKPKVYIYITWRIYISNIPV